MIWFDSVRFACVTFAYVLVCVWTFAFCQKYYFIRYITKIYCARFSYDSKQTVFHCRQLHVQNTIFFSFRWCALNALMLMKPERLYRKIHRTVSHCSVCSSTTTNVNYNWWCFLSCVAKNSSIASATKYLKCKNNITEQRTNSKHNVGVWESARKRLSNWIEHVFCCTVEFCRIFCVYVRHMKNDLFFLFPCWWFCFCFCFHAHFIENDNTHSTLTTYLHLDAS